MTDMEEKEYKQKLMEYEIEKDFTDKVNDDEFFERLAETNTSEEIKELVKDIKERTKKYGRLVRPLRIDYIDGKDKTRED